MNKEKSEIVVTFEEKSIQLHQLIQQSLESLKQTSYNDFKVIKQSIESNYEEIIDELVNLIRNKKKECLNQISGVVKSQEFVYKLCHQKLIDIEKQHKKADKLRQFQFITKVQALLKKANTQGQVYQDAMKAILKKQDVISSVIRQISKRYQLCFDKNIPSNLNDNVINKKEHQQHRNNEYSPLQDILIRVQQESKQLKVFNLKSNKIKIIKTNYQFPKNFALYQTSFSLFVSGGELNDKQLSQFLNVHRDGTIIKLQDMKRQKQLHSLTGNQAALIESCGIRSQVQSNQINEIDLSLNKWKKLPNCLQAKSQHASCLFNFHTLYLFGGKAGDLQTSFIEKFNFKGDNQWNIVDYSNQIFIPAKCLSAVQCQKSVILLFGSFKTQQNLLFDVSQDNFVMDIEDDNNHPDASNGIVSMSYKQNLVVLDNCFSASVWNGQKWRVIYQEKELQ